MHCIICTSDEWLQMSLRKVKPLSKELQSLGQQIREAWSWVESPQEIGENPSSEMVGLILGVLYSVAHNLASIQYPENARYWGIAIRSILTWDHFIQILTNSSFWWFQTCNDTFISVLLSTPCFLHERGVDSKAVTAERFAEAQELKMREREARHGPRHAISMVTSPWANDVR